MRAESQPVPPKIHAPPSLPAFAAIVLGAAVLGAGAVVFFFNPSTHGFYPVCLFHELTGLNCPGCGGTRAVYAAAARTSFARAEGQRAVRARARRAGGARRVVRRAKNSATSRPDDFLPAKCLWALLVIAVVFTRVAESAGVFLSLALKRAGTFRFCRRAGSCSISSMSLTHPLTTTTFDLPGYRVTKSFGVVRGIIVRSRSVIGNIGASIQAIFGGNISLYTNLCERAREDTFNLMLTHAGELGANAVIGVRYDATEIAPGITEVLCYGTAVFVEASRLRELTIEYFQSENMDTTSAFEVHQSSNHQS